MKALQTFSSEYLAHCRSMTPKDIVIFLEDFRKIHGPKSELGPSQLISMKVPKSLLGSFKARCQQLGVPYQTQIKRLMTHWLLNRR